MRTGYPRWLVLVGTLFAGLVAAPLMHVALPNALSALMPRVRWVAGRPSLWNLFGLIAVVAGGVLLLQAVLFHVRSMPARVTMSPTPGYLVRHGSYRVTRNPMYLAGLLLWLGWALFYGSLPVVGGASVWAALTNFVVIPREERALEEVFGETYRHYRDKTRRWL